MRKIHFTVFNRSVKILVKTLQNVTFWKVGYPNIFFLKISSSGGKAQSFGSFYCQKLPSSNILKKARKNCLPAIRMTSPSRYIYFHTPSRNWTKLWPVKKYKLESFIMSVLSPFFDNFVLIFFAHYLLSLPLLTSSVFGRLTARNCLQWSQN